MLKFTKYRRAASTGNVEMNTPPVVLTSFSEFPIKTPDEEMPKSVVSRHERVSLPNCASEFPVPHHPSSFNPHPEPHLHLTRTKVSEEELMRMDMLEEDAHSTGNRSATPFEDPPSDIYNSFESSLKVVRKRSRNMISMSFRNSLKLPVYNDGYFPRIRPLTKLLALTRSNSVKCSSLK